MNKRQLKKMSRAAADWFIDGSLRSCGEVLFDAVAAEWVWYSDLIEGDYSEIKCIDIAFSYFDCECTNWDDANESNCEEIKPIYPKGFRSLSMHKRLLLAISHLRANP